MEVTQKMQKQYEFPYMPCLLEMRVTLFMNGWKQNERKSAEIRVTFYRWQMYFRRVCETKHGKCTILYKWYNKGRESRISCGF